MGIDEIIYKVALVGALLAFAGMFVLYEARGQEISKYRDYKWILDKWRWCEADSKCVAAIVFHDDRNVGGSSGIGFYDENGFNYTFLNRTETWGYAPVQLNNSA